MKTKIKCKFINGEVLEVEVDDIIVDFILKYCTTREASTNRKERLYNFSLEAALYKDVKFYAADGSLDQRIIQFEQYEEILQFIETQTQLAQEMGTAVPGGTSSSALLSCLANNLGSTVYRTVTTARTPFNTGLQYSIDNNVPVVCLVQTGVLPIYNENNKDTGHFLVAKGYYWGMQGSSGGNYVRYLDPNNNTIYYGQHDTSWDIMELAINNGGGYYTMKY